MGFRWKQTVLRAKSTGSIDNDGMAVEPTYEEISILATVQPLKENEKNLYTVANPNGEFYAGMVKVYSDVPLLTVKQADSSVGPAWADYIPWQGRYYKVVSCDAYQSGVISHYKSIAQEVDFDGVIGSEDVPEESDTG